MINAGVNGELSAAGVTRLKRLLNTYNPQLLLLCHGGNDILQKGDLNKMADNLSAMITLAQNKGIQVILIAVPRVSLLLSAAQQYQQVADEKQVVIDNELLAELLKQPALRSDLVHLNASGYQQMAEILPACCAHTVQFQDDPDNRTNGCTLIPAPLNITCPPCRINGRQYTHHKSQQRDHNNL